MNGRDDKGRFTAGNRVRRESVKKKEAAELFRDASVKAVKMLVKAMDDETLTSNGRLEAAKEILNRVYGRGVQLAREEEESGIVVRFEGDTEEYGR